MSSRYYEDQSEFPNRNNGYGSYTARDDRSRSKEEYRPITQNLHPGRSFNSEMSEGSLTCQSVLEGIIRPCFAEFAAVFVTIFLTSNIDAELSERHVSSIQRISIISIVDAVAATIFISAFKTVHLHPAVTVANLFSLSTSWMLCILLFLIQFLSALLAVVATMALKGESPAYIAVNHDINTEWSRAAYRMMFFQVIGTSLVVVSHLMTYNPNKHGTITLGSLSGTPWALFMAISLSSFLSLLHSSLNWNSLLATSVSIVKLVFSNGTQSVFEQWIFWLGPGIGALLACSLFRLVYAPEERRLFKCCGTRETIIL